MLLEQVSEPRHEARVKDEGQRRAEELWAESERRAVARRKAEEGLHRLAALGPGTFGASTHAARRNICALWRAWRGPSGE